MRQLADYADELSEMLSGVKIENVALSQGHEVHREYVTRQMPSGAIMRGTDVSKSKT